MRGREKVPMDRPAQAHKAGILKPFSKPDLQDGGHAHNVLVIQVGVAFTR